VPIYCRTQHGTIVLGDVELDTDGHIVFAPSKEELQVRLGVKGATQLAGRV
jgi:hypothetical protein